MCQVQDDESITDDCLLLRRIPNWHFHEDSREDRMRPSSAAFEDGENGSPMSVYLKDELNNPEVVLENHEGFGLVEFPVSLARANNQCVVRDETGRFPEAHALVVGNKTYSVRKTFAVESQWLVHPSDVSYND